MVFCEAKLSYVTGKGPVPEALYAIPLGEADVKREGDDRDRRRHHGDGAAGARGGGDPLARGRERGGHRPAHPAPARRGHHPRLGPQDLARPRRARGVDDGRLRGPKCRRSSPTRRSWTSMRRCGDSAPPTCPCLTTTLWRGRRFRRWRGSPRRFGSLWRSSGSVGADPSLEQPATFVELPHASFEASHASVEAVRCVPRPVPVAPRTSETPHANRSFRDTARRPSRCSPD